MDIHASLHMDPDDEIELRTYDDGETAGLPAYVTLMVGDRAALYPVTADQCAEFAEQFKAAEKFLREARAKEAA